jgi:hypothetical protein
MHVGKEASTNSPSLPGSGVLIAPRSYFFEITIFLDFGKKKFDGGKTQQAGIRQ